MNPFEQWADDNQIAEKLGSPTFGEYRAVIGSGHNNMVSGDHALTQDELAAVWRSAVALDELGADLAAVKAEGRKDKMDTAIILLVYGVVALSAVWFYLWLKTRR
jgi:hypothetical protein